MIDISDFFVFIGLLGLAVTVFTILVALPTWIILYIFDYVGMKWLIAIIVTIAWGASSFFCGGVLND